MEFKNQGKQRIKELKETIIPKYKALIENEQNPKRKYQLNNILDTLYEELACEYTLLNALKGQRNILPKRYYATDVSSKQSFVINQNDIDHATWQYRFSEIPNEDILIIWAEKYYVGNNRKALLESCIIDYVYGCDSRYSNEYARDALDKFIKSGETNLAAKYYDEVTE